MTRSTRRMFIRMLGTGSAALVFPRSGRAAEAIVVGVVLPDSGPSSDAVAMGIEFGAIEARQTAGLMRREFRLLSTRAGSAADAASRASRMIAEGAVAIIGGGGGTFDRAIRDVGAPHLAIRLRAEIAPGESEGGLAVTPGFAAWVSTLAADLGSRGYRRWAVGPEWKEACEPIRAGGGEVVSPELAEIVFGNDARGTALPFAGISPDERTAIAWPVLWHGSLFRYGAGELNERFTDQTGTEMNEDSWSGWVAVKLVLEAALRRTSLEEVRIDGHKGALLSFEAGRLRQPIYTIFRGAKGLEVSGA